MAKEFNAEDYLLGLIGYCNNYPIPKLYRSKEQMRRWHIGYNIGKAYYPDKKVRMRRDDLDVYIEGFRLYCRGLAKDRGPSDIKWRIGYDIAAACCRCQSRRERVLSRV